MTAAVLPLRRACKDCGDGRPCYSCRQELYHLEQHAERRLLALPRGGATVGSAELTERAPNPLLRAVAEQWKPDDGQTLILGPTGEGKTQVLGALGQRLHADARASRDPRHYGWGWHWVTAPGLAQAMRESRLGTTCDELRAAQHAHILLLDELGAERADPGWLLEVVDARYAAGLPTVTTSGFPRVQLEARYGPAAVRRLVEPGGFCLDLFGSSQ